MGKDFKKKMKKKKEKTFAVNGQLDRSSEIKHYINLC